MSDHLDLADYRRRVFALYEQMRRDGRADPLRLVNFRSAKDRLLAEHPQSPIAADERRDFRGLAYWRHDPALALSARLEPDADAPPLDLPLSGEGAAIPFARIGWVSFEVGGVACRLSVYWLNDYAGGIFIPFRDGTSGARDVRRRPLPVGLVQGRRPRRRR